MQEQGFAAAPGTHTLVAMKRYEVSTLPLPYGICDPTSPPVSECNAQCQARQVIHMCGCQTEYMQPFSHNTTTCDFKTSLSCVRQALADMMKSEWECDCSPPCNQTRYEPQLSYAQLSRFNIDRMILDNPDKQKVLEENFMKARETSQRYREEIKVKDMTDMTRLVNITDRLKHNLQNIRVQTTDPLNTSQHFTLPAVLVKEPIFMDLDLLKYKLINLENLASSWLADTKTRILYNLEYTNDTFLEWSDGMYRFHQFLKNCSQEASEAERNDSSNGSGEVNLAWTNSTRLTYVSGTCTENLQAKINLMKTSLSYAYFARVDFKQLEDGYRKLLVSVFQNSTESADAYDDHMACLHVLRSELIKETYPELYNELETFTKADRLEDATWSVNKIVDTMEVLYGASPNLTRCYWVFSLAWNVTDKVFKNGDNAMNANGRFIESFNTMSGTVVSMAEDVESLGKTILEMIISYMNGNVTKMELARYILSSKAIQELSRHERNADIIIKSLQERLTNYMSSVASIYVTMAESPIYIVSVEEIKELELFKMSYNTNRTDFQHLIDGLHENMTNVHRLLDLVYSEYQQSYQQLLGALPSAFKELSDHLSMLRDDLQVYAESTSLNTNFFMENFLQLDVFYKDMSYEVVTQQEAFGLLSLLGEVGGFLGLLLGASVITVCELLDYILLHVTARCTAGHRDRDPNMV